MTHGDLLDLVATAGPVIGIIGLAGVIGWVLTTWLRIKNGYPLDGQWGQALYPKRDDETVERVKLLTQENELGAIMYRLANVERIVTDSGNMLSHEIERLRDRAN